MSRRTIASLFVLIFGLSTLALTTGCPNFGSFTFTEVSDVIEVEGQNAIGSGTPLDDLIDTRVPMEVNLQQELEEQDASSAESVHLIDLYFELEDDSDEEDFDFMDEITITVSSDNHAEAELAWKDPIPDGEERFELERDEDLDLKPYAEDGLRLNTDASGSAPEEDARFRVYAEFRVHVM